MLPHEVMYNLITEQGMDVKRASCVEARVEQRLEDMNRHCCKQFNRDPDIWICISWHCDGVPIHNVQR